MTRATTGYAKGKTLAPPKAMNGLEAAWSHELLAQMATDQILEWRWQPFRLYLTEYDRLTSYEPDFLVMLPDKTLRVDEVKGFWRDDARVKLKLAVDRFPFFRFQAITRKRGQWQFEAF